MDKICWVCGSTISEPVAEKLETSVTELGLSSRARNSLKQNSIETVEQLIKLDHKRLLLMRNVGEHTAKEIISKVKLFGFVWGN